MEFEIYCEVCKRLIKVVEKRSNDDSRLKEIKCSCAYCGVEMFDENKSKKFYTIEWDD